MVHGTARGANARRPDLGRTSPVPHADRVAGAVHAIQRHIEDELSEFIIRHKDNIPERIDFTMNGEEVLLMPRAIEGLTQ
jgi:hypothetical protein